MAKQIDLQAQNAVAVRNEVLDHGTSANGKSTPNTFEAWSIHAREVSDKNVAMPGKKLGSTTLRKQAGKWVATVRGATPGRLGEAARLLAAMR